MASESKNMSKYKNEYRIESTRLKGWNYSSSGWYFITTNTKNNLNHFGKVNGDNIIYNSLGKIALSNWENIPKHFPEVETDFFMLMPNHLHGILILDESDESNSNHSIGDIIGKYKAAVTRWARKNGYPEFSWQSRFYDRIIRNEEELKNIRNYILYNSHK